jgi:hypothetical protein
MKVRKPKSHQTVTHKLLGLKFDIVGAKLSESLGPCFVVIGEGDETNRERIFQTTMFEEREFVLVLRDALYFELLENEPKRLKNKMATDKAKEKRSDALRRSEDDAEDEELELQYRDIGAETLAEYEPSDPLEPIENSETISDEDSEGHESLDVQEVELVEED